MPEVSATNQLLLTICIIAGLGVAWLAVRMVFKVAMRVFMLGCVGIILLGLLLILSASNLPAQ